jgi:hypothetical protein
VHRPTTSSTLPRSITQRTRRRASRRPQGRRVDDRWEVPHDPRVGDLGPSARAPLRRTIAPTQPERGPPMLGAPLTGLNATTESCSRCRASVRTRRESPTGLARRRRTVPAAASPGSNLVASELVAPCLPSSPTRPRAVRTVAGFGDTMPPFVQHSGSVGSPDHARRTHRGSPGCSLASTATRSRCRPPSDGSSLPARNRTSTWPGSS